MTSPLFERSTRLRSPIYLSDTLPLAAGGFRHLVSKRAWGLLAFEGAGLCLRGLGAEQERKFCQQVISAAHDLPASHIQGSPAWTAA